MNAYRPIIVVGIIAALLLAACGGASGTTSVSSQSELSTGYTDALPVGGQLAAGTLKLEGSDLAVDAQQAASLLPMWQGLSSLMASATSSDQEIQGVVAQIQSAMTADQLAAISAMQLTQADLAEIVQNAGPAANAGTTSSDIQATRRASSGGEFGPGPGGGGGPGMGGGGEIIGGGSGGAAGLPGASSGFPQATVSADQQETAQAYLSQYESLGVNPMMVRTVIQYLQSKSG
jgi:hypothetical protein